MQFSCFEWAANYCFKCSLLHYHNRFEFKELSTHLVWSWKRNSPSAQKKILLTIFISGDGNWVVKGILIMQISFNVASFRSVFAWTFECNAMLFHKAATMSSLSLVRMHQMISSLKSKTEREIICQRRRLMRVKSLMELSVNLQVIERHWIKYKHQLTIDTRESNRDNLFYRATNDFWHLLLLNLAP